MIGGMGVGVASMLSPLYISELSPPGDQGTNGSLQFAITIGILCSYFTNAGLMEISVRSGVISMPTA